MNKKIFWYLPAIAMLVVFAIFAVNEEYSHALLAFIACCLAYEAGNLRVLLFDELEQHGKDLKLGIAIIEKLTAERDALQVQRRGETRT